ncbi:histidine phosphatase family protein [Paenalcaligenes niemegkensis]|uniref:histidine phosphatase family protein n=1 Tax=Paenalcaligenes niemegkensis TaxID=2895469 RepID=UPI001EE7B83C|nr:histidine phosphatase family protein [Paenalcaligenes niemegkensis]MCQ9615816.1 histidine phosphatase family protein [Paenalcaligenes niemegkensis]
MTITNFWLIRHGETSWNAERRLQGWQDIPLNEVGIAQANELAAYLASNPLDITFDLLVSSDLKRASQTAEIACAHMGLDLILEPGLRERGFGIWEGRSWDSFGETGPDQPGANTQDLDHAVEGAESIRKFQDRVIGSFEALARKSPEQNIIVFAHGGVIDMVWRKLHNVDLNTPRTERILNASINHFSLHALSNSYEWRVRNWAQTQHVEKALDDIG